MVSCHLAWYLADAGHRVLVLDLDRQHNTTNTLADFQKLGTCKPLFEPGYIVPEMGRLSVYTNMIGGEYDAQQSVPLRNLQNNFPLLSAHFDYCVIDTPPSWSYFNFGALSICDHLIIPIEVAGFSIDATKRLSDSIRVVNKNGRAGRCPVNLLGVIANRVRVMDKSQRETLEALRAKIGRNLFATHLAERAHYSQALNKKVPVWRYDGADVRASAPDMRAVMDEVMTRIEAYKP